MSVGRRGEGREGVRTRKQKRVTPLQIEEKRRRGLLPV